MRFRRGITPDEKFIETRHKGFFLPEAAVATMFKSIILTYFSVPLRSITGMAGWTFP
jgi:hypothetical protein